MTNLTFSLTHLCIEQMCEPINAGRCSEYDAPHIAGGASRGAREARTFSMNEMLSNAPLSHPSPGISSVYCKTTETKARKNTPKINTSISFLHDVAGHVLPGDCNVARALKITRKENRSHRNVPVHGEFVEGSEQAHFDGVCKDMRSILIEVAWKMECEGPRCWWSRVACGCLGWSRLNEKHVKRATAAASCFVRGWQ